MKLFTIGFTKKSAQEFFTALRRAGATKLIDVRLNNVSQLAGFTKRRDLEYFLGAISGMEYVHLLELAPTQEMLDAYKKGDRNWASYETRFLELIKERRVEELPRDLFANACLLCSEQTPHRCHRRLVAEYLKAHWPHVDIVHL